MSEEDDKKRIDELEKRIKELEERVEPVFLRPPVFGPRDWRLEPICGACRMNDPPTGRKKKPDILQEHEEEWGVPK